MVTLGQELGNDEEWRRSYSHKQENDSALNVDSETPILDETIAIVQEKVWSFRAALKGMAEALVNFGLSPTVVGYSTVPLGEDECPAEKDEGEAALRQVMDQEILARSPSTRRSEESALEGEESSRLVHHDEDYDDSNHAFVEASRKESDEMKSLTGRWMGELEDDDDDLDHTKDK